MALALGAILLLSPTLDRGRDRPLLPVFAAGLLAGAATLTRPAMLFFLALVALWLITRRRVLVVVAIAAGSLLVVAPWTARNYDVHGRFVLVAADGGVTFWTGNHPLAIGEKATWPPTRRSSATSGSSRRVIRDAATRRSKGSTFARRSRFILDHPGRWAC